MENRIVFDGGASTVVLAHRTNIRPGAAKHPLSAECATKQLSPATKKAYIDQWSRFEDWSVSRGSGISLPVPVETVAAYLSDRASALGRSGACVILAAIGFQHRQSGHPWPRRHPLIESAVNQITDMNKNSTKLTLAIAGPEIRRLLLHCCIDLNNSNGLIGLRNRALVLTCFACGLRRGELVALDRNDITFTPDGLVIRLRPLNTEQDVEYVNVTSGVDSMTCPVIAMKSWLENSKIQSGQIFRRVKGNTILEGALTGNSVWKIMRRLTNDAGLVVGDHERISPHSIRVGFIVDAYRRGADDKQVMDLARQKSLCAMRVYKVYNKVDEVN